MPGYKNITSVNYEQLELLLQYAVARKSANESAAFASGNQYFLDVDSGALKIYTGASDTPIYNSETAFNVLAYVKTIEWDGTNYAHKLTKHKADNTEETYSIEKIEKIDSDSSTTYLPYIRIGTGIYKIPRDWSDLTSVPSTFPPSSHTHTKSEITDFGHTHTKSEITDFAHTHVKADITDFAHTHLKADITDFAHTHLKADITDFAHTHTVANITDFPTLASVATSGNYSDLSGTPSSLSDFTNDLIEANPSSGTPTAVLSTIQIGNVLYELSGGTTVIANPGGTASQTLTAIQIGSVIYSVSGGGGGGGMNNPMTAAGDIIYGGISGTPTALPKGIDGQFLSLASGVPSWITFTGLVDPTTTQGDILIRGTNGIERLGIGSNGQVLTSNGTTASWQTPSGGGEPAAYIKSISKSGRTITWTKKDDSTDSLDTSYSDATQSDSGLMSATDKTKLDGLVSNKAEVLFAGLADGGTSTDLPSSTIALYSVILLTVHSQYADSHKRTIAIPVSSIGNFSIQETIFGWNDPLNIYVYYDSDYLRCNAGSGHTLYITSVIGIKA